MSVVIRSQVRRRRGFALLAAAWLLLCGFLAARHEAHVAHVADRAGHSLHAPGLITAHTSPDSDFHAAEQTGADADCELAALCHQAVAAPRAAASLLAGPVRAEVPRSVPTRTAAIARARYLVAPKTSPPARG